MPIYEFECGDCGNVVTQLYLSQPKVAEESIVRYCTICREAGKTFKRIISLSNFHLKGGGVGWGADRYSSACESGDEVVALDEP